MADDLKKQSSHFRTVKDMSVKATFFFMKKPQQTDFKMILKCCWNPSEPQSFVNDELTRTLF